MKLLKSLQYQNPLFLFDASIVTSGVAVVLLKGILSLSFGWTPGLDDNFKVAVCLFFYPETGEINPNL